MACDCDQLMNRIRDLEGRVKRLEGGGRGGGGSGGGNQDDLLERVFRDKRWIAATECLQFIIKGKV